VVILLAAEGQWNVLCKAAATKLPGRVCIGISSGSWGSQTGNALQDSNFEIPLPASVGVENDSGVGAMPEAKTEPPRTRSSTSAQPEPSPTPAQSHVGANPDSMIPEFNALIQAAVRSLQPKHSYHRDV
jgi:hypothetical protein